MKPGRGARTGVVRLRRVHPEQLSTVVRDALQGLVDDGSLVLDGGVPAEVTVERPRQKGHGDYATNVALQLAKRAGTRPRALATLLADSHRIAEAMDVLRDALRIDREDVSARKLLAMILLRLKNEPHGQAYDREVRTAFEELVRLSPDDLDARLNAGKLAFESGDLGTAREDHLARAPREPVPDEVSGERAELLGLGHRPE